MKKEGNLWFGVNKTLIITLVLVIVFELLAFNFVDKPLTGNAIQKIFVKSAQTNIPVKCIPTTEICDRKDNNCNGQIDEGGVCEKYKTTPMTLSSSQRASYLSASSDPPGTTDYYGAVTIDGIAALPGTVISAITAANITCGNFTVTNQNPGIGFYGFLHCTCGGDMPVCAGNKITFAILKPGDVSYKNAQVSGDTTWDGSVKRVDLNINTKCTDGTLYNVCTGQGSAYCSQYSENYGEVVHACSICGCPSTPKPYTCKSNGYCSNEALEAQAVRDVGGIL
ncbi:MAG: MopE-related protein [Nanoarchaeota archaeon]